nr:integrase arm-type DNA-binding domain-containing protein [uncultured Rhodoferax sp.]
MATRYRLSDKDVDSFNLNDDESDRELKDGGNLQLRVRRGSRGITKKWEFQYKLNGKRETIQLGSFPDVSLDEARELAVPHQKHLAVGKSPKAALEEDEAVKHAQAMAAVHGEEPTTVRELFERWDQDYLKVKHDDEGAYIRGIFERHILALGHGEVKLKLLKVSHVTAVLTTARNKGLKRTCSVMLSAYRQMVNWAFTREWLDKDPTRGLKASEYDDSEGVSERALSYQEITQLAHRLSKSYTSNKWKKAVNLILAAGSRIEETMLIKRANINLAARTILIPIPDQKQVQRKMYDHVIYLSDFALAQVEALLAMPNTHTFLFPGETKKGEVPGSVSADEQTLTKELAKLQGRDYKGRRSTDELLLTGGPFGSHDLRRTCATGMGEEGVPFEIAELCINHRTNDPYHHAEKRAQMERAWDVWGKKLEELYALPDPEPHYAAPRPKYLVFDTTDPLAVARRQAEETVKAQRKEERAAKAAAKAISKARKTRPNPKDPKATQFKPVKKKASSKMDFGDSDLI